MLSTRSISRFKDEDEILRLSAQDDITMQLPCGRKISSDWCRQFALPGNG
jgi:hypothetical protein